VTEAEFDPTIAVNVKAAFFALQQAEVRMADDAQL